MKKLILLAILSVFTIPVMASSFGEVESVFPTEHGDLKVHVFKRKLMYHIFKRYSSNKTSKYEELIPTSSIRFSNIRNPIASLLLKKKFNQYVGKHPNPHLVEWKIHTNKVIFEMKGLERECQVAIRLYDVGGTNDAMISDCDFHVKGKTITQFFVPDYMYEFDF